MTNKEWETWENEDIVKRFPNGQEVGLICSFQNSLFRDEQAANLALVAAAPDLLGACREVLNIIIAYSHIPAQFKACQILQDAISKAEGRNEE